jgi:hypothetical protein
MIKYTVRHFGVDKTFMWRNLNWNNRNRPLTAAEKNKGWVPPRDKNRKGPKYANGRWVPIILNANDSDG